MPRPKRKRHPLRVITVAKTDGCPTPNKRGYPTKALAKKVIARMHLPKEKGVKSEMAPYRCKCGAFHVGHKRGTTYNKLRKAGMLDEQIAEREQREGRHDGQRDASPPDPQEVLQPDPPARHRGGEGEGEGDAGGDAGLA